jgi:protein-tyrosine phosphatase
VIDLHSHPLPGLDDGPATTEEALALLRGAAEAGTHTIVATPHLSANHPGTRADGVAAAVHALQAAADEAGIDVRLVAGAEVELLHAEMVGEESLRGLQLGEGPYMLVELPFGATAELAEGLIGMTSHLQPAVLAHPERCRAFHDDPELLARLVDQGMLAQITAASIAGAYGSTAQRCAWDMLEQGLVHVVASDAHDAVRRPPLLREPLEAAGLAELLPVLCDTGPAAILAGGRPDPAPPARRPRALRHGFKRAALGRR